MKLIETLDCTGHVLYGGPSNSNFHDGDMRKIILDVSENSEHLFVAQFYTGRYVPTVGSLVRDYRQYQSPIFKTAEEASKWATDVRDWAKENYTGLVLKPVKFPFEVDHWTLCPKCDWLNTLQVTLQAYGNLTECGHCDYSDFYDIGD